MPREETRRPRTHEERAKALSVGAVVIVLCFVAGLVVSLRGMGVDLTRARPPAQGSLEPRTVDGTVTYIRVDDGGHAIACSSTYTSSSCSTIGIILSPRSGPK